MIHMYRIDVPTIFYYYFFYLYYSVKYKIFFLVVSFLNTHMSFPLGKHNLKTLSIRGFLHTYYILSILSYFLLQYIIF